MVVLRERGCVAAAGFIYLLRPRWHCQHTYEQADFAYCKFLVFCSFQSTKSACSAAAEKCLSGMVTAPFQRQRLQKV